MKKLALIIMLLFANHVLADDDLLSTCHGKFVNPITDVCWTCLFPLTIGAMKVYPGAHADTKNPSSPVCGCKLYPAGYRVGLSLGFWEPISIADVTRSPFCMVNLGGKKLKFGKYYRQGEVDTVDPEHGGSFYHVHWYKYPLLVWLNLITSAFCLENGEFDIFYLTELDPAWNDDELAFLINPEAILFGNVLAQTACAADSVASIVGKPLDSLFWCMGSHGGSYPITGRVQEHVGGVQSSTLVTERMAFKMHREGLLWDSDAKHLCREITKPFMPKSRYRYQMVNPVPANSEPFGCKPFGHTTAVWGAGREFPYKGEDFGYLIWRKRNCCAG